MTGENAETEFLNVDLDIAGETDDLETLLNSIKSAVVVLNHVGRFASVELAEESGSLEETVTGLLDLICTLEPQAKSIWDRLEFRRANIGVQAASEPHAACFAISAKAVEQLAALRFEIVVTVYAPVTD
ncbi:hypothetical protein [Bradyrhizobium sp. HKCCYLR20261]|uniref:hypothetical protein n=1 Tax=Bradyrhizobium sp. HKCCYLR20261 TaxID=3420760 RepID=UPI003EB6F941